MESWGNHTLQRESSLPFSSAVSGKAETLVRTGDPAAKRTVPTRRWNPAQGTPRLEAWKCSSASRCRLDQEETRESQCPFSSKRGPQLRRSSLLHLLQITLNSLTRKKWQQQQLKKYSVLNCRTASQARCRNWARSGAFPITLLLGSLPSALRAGEQRRPAGLLAAVTHCSAPEAGHSPSATSPPRIPDPASHNDRCQNKSEEAEFPFFKLDRL